MFDQIIHTFLLVAEQKSFSAAAKQLYLSPNAVKKRIESLEQQSGLVLFTRTNQGCELTKAGLSLYQDLLQIDKHYQAAVSKATYIQEQANDVLYIGIMSTFGESFMISPWFNIRKKLFANQLRLVYYAASLNDMDRMFAEVGTVTTLCIDVYDESFAKQNQLYVKKTSSFPLCIGFPASMEPEKCDKITFQMLSGCTIAVLPMERVKVFDRIRQELLQTVADIQIADLEEYSIRSINDCYMNRQLILAAYNQTAHYPFYKFIPLDTQLTLDFGAYYRRQDENRLREFMQKITSTDTE